MRRFLSVLLCCCLAAPTAVFAAPQKTTTSDLPPPPPPPPPMPPPEAGSECFPACRAGFFCSAGQCRSACNPPCGANEQCQSNGECTSMTSAPLDPSAEDDGPRREGPRMKKVYPTGSDVSADGTIAPAGFHFEKTRRKGLLIMGPILFGVGYILSGLWGLYASVLGGSLASSAFDQSFANRTSGNYLMHFIPVFGPFAAQIGLATNGGYRSQFRVHEFVACTIFTLLQAGGITSFVLGLLGTTETLVRDEYVGTSRSSDFKVTFAPFSPGAEVGASLMGTF